MSSYSIVYPKPLPPLENQTLINDNGFALTEIAALRNGWRLINRRFMYHSRAIFMGFFEENENFLEQFRDQKGKLNMSHLHQHPQLLLSTYGNLIMKALDDSTYINVLMTDISQRHRIFGVTYEHIKALKK
ncbi:uncharacterized protein LOC142219414 isoform X2 [Haematobia irritans]|uniref:uncharacterized protein LOC142219414 isoform X2 n=1 Tax=Haematobia irritans TaxID=7368 RepID=UPI003F4F8844